MNWFTRNPAARVATWTLSLACFVLGLVLGLNNYATAGAACWGLCALLALVPFISHRDNG